MKIRGAAVGFATTFAVIAGAAPAQAAGFYTARYTGEHGHPVTDNATAIYFNPGAMTRGKGSRLLGDANIAIRSLSYERQGHASDEPPPAGSTGFEEANIGTAEALNVLVGPTIGFITEFDKLALGILIHGPFGGAVQFDEDERFVDNPTFAGPADSVARYSVITANLASVYFSLGAAYEIVDSLSVGAALNLIYSTVRTTRAQNGTTGENALETEGRTSLDVSGIQWSFGAGAMWEAVKDELWIGASYQAQPNVSGGMVLEGEQSTYFVNPNGSASERSAPADLHQTYPDVIRLGLAHRPQTQLEWRLFGDWQRWSVLENQCVSPRGKDCETGPNGAAINRTSPLVNARRDWQDAFGVRAGISYWTSETRDLELFGGLGFESNSAPDATLDASLHDAAKFSAAVGGRIALGENFRVAASYTHLQYLNRDNRNKSTASELAVPSKTPDMGGIYRSWVGLFNVNGELAF